MKTPLQYFRIVAKEFAAIPDGEIQDYLDIAAPSISACRFGTQYGYAVALMAAHLYATIGADGADTSGRGPVTSETVGPLSASYANMGASGSAIDMELSRSSYGQKLTALKRTIFKSPLVC